MPYADPERKKESGKKWREENKDRLREYNKKYREDNKELKKDYKKKYREENKDKIREYFKKWYEKNKDKVREYGKENRDAHTLSSIKKRALNKGLPFDLELEDIANPGICPVLGISMERGTRLDSHNSPSVDRIAPSLGYVKGNVQVISKKANTMKLDATPEELRMFAKWVLKTFPEEPDAQA